MGKDEKASNQLLRERFLTVGKFVLLVGILITVGLLSALIGMQVAVRGNEVATPDVLGKTGEEAEQALKADRLRLAVISERYDADRPPGTILSQSPAPGGRVKVGQKVRVALSLGPRKHPVPNLVGETLRAARARIVQTEYRVGNVSEFFLPGVIDGKVIRQFPEAGSESSGQTQIDLLVARDRPAEYIMPEVVGKELSSVYKLFEPQGFAVGNVRYQPSPFSKPGTVLRQYPEAGSKLRADQRINLEVARKWP